jgi:IS30 family transposase
MKRKAINSHFTKETRIDIENQLNEGKSPAEIGKNLDRDPSNIRKEIKKHSEYVYTSIFNGKHPCVKFDNCSLKGFDCFKYCKSIEIKHCPKLEQSPHICNGCNTKNGCRYVKKYYKAETANCEYKNSLKESRVGLHYTENELSVLNNDFTILVIKNKSVYHSLKIINQRGFHFKMRTIYNQIKNERLALKLEHLPRNRKKVTTLKPDTDYKNIEKVEGCTYEDYISYKEKNPNSVEIQMDTVEGTKELNAPVFLTFKIVKIEFLLVFKIDKQTQEKVLEKLILLKNLLGEETFNKLFEILLTDNGKEFNNPKLIKETFNNVNLFYCHPYSSYEKGSIENNHEFIRRVIPKSVPLSIYSQKEVNLLCSHINSLYRESLGGQCPFDLVEEYIPKKYLDILNLHRINAENVTLIPELLGSKNVENIKKYLDKKEIKDANISFLDDETIKLLGLKK